MGVSSGYGVSGAGLARGFGVSGAGLVGGSSVLQQILGTAGLQALYDPSDLTSLYQSRTGGSTGAVDSVVGIMLDKSEMGGKTAAAFIAGQSELSVNGGFATDTDWSKGAGWTISGGKATHAAGSTSNLTSVTQIMTVGNWYAITFTVSGRTAGNLTPLAGSTGAGSAVSADGTVTQILRAATNGNLYLQGSSSFDGSVDDVSIKALPGYHALAPSDAARPILRSASSKNYLDTDGTDDWMQIFPTLNLGEQWWHVGGWKNDTGSDAAGVRAFTTSNNASGYGALTFATTNGNWRNSSATQTAVLSGAATSAGVATLEQTSTTVLNGRWNGANGLTITPFDDSADTQGVALFSARNSAFLQGLDGRFYGGAFGTGTLSSSDRALLERYVASLTGVSL